MKNLKMIFKKKVKKELFKKGVNCKERRTYVEIVMLKINMVKNFVSKDHQTEKRRTQCKLKRNEKVT